MARPKKLPLDVFADSPLRPTSLSRQPEPSRADEDLHSSDAPSSGAEASPVVARPAAAHDELVKRTVYIPTDVLDAMEEEVYLRRKAGDRTCDFGEVHREVLRRWVARRKLRVEPSPEAPQT